MSDAYHIFIYSSPIVASALGHLEVVRYLLESGSNKDKGGKPIFTMLFTVTFFILPLTKFIVKVERIMRYISTVSLLVYFIMIQ